MIEMSTPGGLEESFFARSVPDSGGELPELQGPPPKEAIDALVTTFSKHDIAFAMH